MNRSSRVGCQHRMSKRRSVHMNRMAIAECRVIQNDFTSVPLFPSRVALMITEYLLKMNFIENALTVNLFHPYNFTILISALSELENAVVWHQQMIEQFHDEYYLHHIYLEQRQFTQTNKPYFQTVSFSKISLRYKYTNNIGWSFKSLFTWADSSRRSIAEWRFFPVWQRFWTMKNTHAKMQLDQFFPDRPFLTIGKFFPHSFTLQAPYNDNSQCESLWNESVQWHWKWQQSELSCNDDNPLSIASMITA